MIKSIVGKFRLFSSLYGKSLALFFSYGLKFLFLALLFTLPLYIADEWLYLHRQNFHPFYIYTLLDSSLYVISFVFFILYNIMLYTAIISAEEQKKIRLFSLWKNIPLQFIPFLVLQLFYVLKVVLWSLALIIPGVISFFVYSFSGIALLVDGKKGKEAFRQSKELVANHLNCYFDMLVLLIIVQAAISTPIYLLINQGRRFLYIASHYFLSTCIDYMFGLLFIINIVLIQIFFYYLYDALKKDTR